MGRAGECSGSRGTRRNRAAAAATPADACMNPLLDSGVPVAVGELTAAWSSHTSCTLLVLRPAAGAGKAPAVIADAMVKKMTKSQDPALFSKSLTEGKTPDEASHSKAELISR